MRRPTPLKPKQTPEPRQKSQQPELPPMETIEYIRQFARAYRAPLERSSFPGIVLN